MPSGLRRRIVMAVARLMLVLLPLLSASMSTTSSTPSSSAQPAAVFDRAQAPRPPNAYLASSSGEVRGDQDSYSWVGRDADVFGLREPKQELNVGRGEALVLRFDSGSTPTAVRVARFIGGPESGMRVEDLVEAPGNEPDEFQGLTFRRVPWSSGSVGGGDSTIRATASGSSSDELGRRWSRATPPTWRALARLGRRSQGALVSERADRAKGALAPRTRRSRHGARRRYACLLTPERNSRAGSIEHSSTGRRTEATDVTDRSSEPKSTGTRGARTPSSPRIGGCSPHSMTSPVR